MGGSQSPDLLTVGQGWSAARLSPHMGPPERGSSPHSAIRVSWACFPQPYCPACHQTPWWMKGRAPHI